MINNNQKGVSVYITVVIMSILLSVSLGLSSIIVGGAKMVMNLGDSVKAFHAADTGVEKALYCIKVGPTCVAAQTCANTSNTFSAGYGWTITITGSGDCLSAGTSIKSLGTYKTTKRKVEASY